MNSITNNGEPQGMVGTPKAVIVQTAELQALGDRRQAPAPQAPQYVFNPSTQSIAIDHKGQPITQDRILATKPLKTDLHSRRGPGGCSLVYYNGETVSRLLNDIFGFDGWNMSVLKIERICCVQDKDRWQVGYMAHVRVTHRASGTFKEDMGAGDSIDKHMPTAVQNSVKGAITDALKRAARHFGEKLGNSLYSDGFSMNNCPKTLTEALDQYDKVQNNKFQTPKPIQDAKVVASNCQREAMFSKNNSTAIPNSVANYHPVHHNAAQPTNDSYPNPSHTRGIPQNTLQIQPHGRTLVTVENENKRPISCTVSQASTFHHPNSSSVASVTGIPQPPDSSYGHRNIYKKPKLNPYA